MHNFHRKVETPAVDSRAAIWVTGSASHEFDVVRHVLGTDYATITAYQPRRKDSLVAPIVIVLETSDEQLVTIEVNNNATYGYDVRAELVGETASISMPGGTCTRLDAAPTQSTRYDPDWRGRFAEACRRQNHDFVRFVETGQFPEAAPNGRDGDYATLVAEPGIKALIEGRDPLQRWQDQASSHRAGYLFRQPRRHVLARDTCRGHTGDAGVMEAD